MTHPATLKAERPARATPEEREASLTPPNDSRRSRRTRRQFTAAALVLLASVGWARQVSADEYLYALAIDPETPTTLYAGTGCSGVFKSLDGGDSWSAVNTGLTSTFVTALAINPTTPATLYAGATGGGVFRSLNGGGSWSAVNTGLPPDRSVDALAINPTTPTTVYAGTQSGVFRSLNGGDSWQATGHLACGDGLVRCYEECDDGNTVSGDGCDASCRREFCGDGIVQGGLGEECDDGNTSSGDGCDAQCRLPRVVGDGTPQSCTEAPFEAKLAERSVIFNCGPAPVTITLTSEKAITADTIIDGGGLITLSGGGAVRIFAVDAGAALDVRNLTLADGRADYGGGIYNAGTLTLTNCTLKGNSTASYGGGIANEGTATLTNCTLRGNSAGGRGGGIASLGTLTVTNCTLSGNSAVGVGGGIAKDCIPQPPIGCACFGPVMVTNSTFSGNGADAGAGAIDGGCSLRASVTNSIIANSIGANCVAGVFTDGGHNLQWPGTSCGETIPSLDPLLDPSGLKENGGPTQTIALLPGSPAIDAGDPEVCANPPVNGVDQRGHPRPGAASVNCSIGAFESDDPPPCTGDCDGKDGVSIDEIITLVNIALGTSAPAACPQGIPSGADVDVALIIQAVNVALIGCGT